MSRWGRLSTILAACGVACALTCGDVSAQLKKGKALRPETKTCIECHRKESQEFQDRASRHEPVRAGKCESCHLKHGVVGVLRLSAEDPQLCLTCHAMEGAPESGKGVGPKGRESGAASRSHRFSHPPAESLKCGTCHDPHGTDKPHLLRNSGSASCSTCHEPSGFQGASSHPPAAVDCLTCHDPHGSPRAANLSKDTATLCVSCHDGGSAKETSAHGGRRPSPGSCLGCHTPHASQARGLLRQKVHAPVGEGPGSCETCHVARDEGRALQKAVPDLCLECHSDPRATPAGVGEASHVHAPVAEGDCLTCHAPHASDTAGLLKDSQPALCGGCHSEATHAEQSRVKHEPAAECGTCHTPHSGPPDLLKRATADLCEECHAGVKEQTARSHPHPPAAEGECLVCHDPHGSDHAGLLRQPAGPLCATCHDELAQEMGSRVTHAPARDGACVACHEPHGSSQAHMVVPDLARACVGCHKVEALAASVEHLHAPVEGGDCLSCHRPHASTREALLITDTSLLCRSCHEELIGEKTARVRHAPVQRGQCLACHDPHGGHGQALLRRADARSLCLACHLDESRQLVRSDLTAHPPFKQDTCLACHSPHVSREDALLPRPVAELCASCHDPTRPDMTAPHRGLLTASTDCTGCHEPHAAADRALLVADQHAPFRAGECSSCHKGDHP